MATLAVVEAFSTAEDKFFFLDQMKTRRDHFWRVKQPDSIFSILDRPLKEIPPDRRGEARLKKLAADMNVGRETLKRWLEDIRQSKIPPKRVNLLLNRGRRLVLRSLQLT